MLHFPHQLLSSSVTVLRTEELEEERLLELFDHFTTVGLRATTGLGLGLSRRFA